ncbi:MAG: iron-containing alcohol dehydrogenase [Cyanobacteria bacterium P01_F01_bin.150]
MYAFQFAKVPPLSIGTGALTQLPQRIQTVSGKPLQEISVLLVTGSQSLRQSGKLGEVETLFSDASIAYDTIVCPGEPSPDLIDRTCQQYRSNARNGDINSNINMVVAIGGGSVVDAGKAISAMLPHSNSIMDHLEGVGKGIPHSGVKIPFIAIPTTSGTGGEVTKNAVISEVGTNGFKKSIRHDRLVPDAVIVDSDLLVACPQSVTAACGMDALTQLLEPYLSPTANPLTDAIAWSGLETIAHNLLPACGEGADDRSVREGMAYASLMSGVALANAGLGIVHGLASPLGGFFPIPHGVVCGTLVAASVCANWTALMDRAPDSPAVAKMARLGALLEGTSDKSPLYYGEALGRILTEWTEQLKLPRLGEYGIQITDMERILAKTKNRNNPINLTMEEIQGLVEQRL